jgi:hypothetical protein
MLAATGLTVIVPILALGLLGGALVLYRRNKGATPAESDGDVGPDPLDDGGR